MLTWIGGEEAQAEVKAKVNLGSGSGPNVTQGSLGSSGWILVSRTCPHCMGGGRLDRRIWYLRSNMLKVHGYHIK